ncbi:MAG: histidine--tRNA ligase [Bacteroidales bacterium]|nr:histidine--tRNA ligase [Bacteroidales bacterium]MBN2819410.1 histidine--tRNA ligase [Bacteroidales bacterium]
MMQKPSIPKGTRDFSPTEMVKRNYIFDTIKDVFQLYGYQPIETPAMENLGTLLGKYGEEGDKLLFKILDSGQKAGIRKNVIRTVAENDCSRLDLIKGEKYPLMMMMTPSEMFSLTEKGLRYDLTVPFARYVVQHQNEITFPFKRYQIQPVWRADRPQKGRYREFFQCDVDVVGSNSLLNEVELINIIDNVFSKLNISVTIKLNNRKILAGIADYIGAPDLITDITIAIDKLEKVGLENVNNELKEKGLSAVAIEKLQPVLLLSGSNTGKLARLKEVLFHSETGLKGINEVEQIFSYLAKTDFKSTLELDLTLARGLNYYTGAIFEVKANDVQIGSICGGGRYDNLTGIFGLPDVSGVGISFGADRIYDVMNQLDIYPNEVITGTQVLIICFGEEEQIYSLPVVQKLRSAGISAEVYPDTAKLKKQMTYANSKNIPWVVLVGEDELKSGNLTCKDMGTGEQRKLPLDEIIKLIVKDIKR